jgi:hypothetical protein
MDPRDPLTERAAHQLRDTKRDPWDWIEGPQEPALLAERADPWHRGPDAWIVIVLTLLSVAAVALIAWAVWIVFHP